MHKYDYRIDNGVQVFRSHDEGGKLIERRYPFVLEEYACPDHVSSRWVVTVTYADVIFEAFTWNQNGVSYRIINRAMGEPAYRGSLPAYDYKDADEFKNDAIQFWDSLRRKLEIQFPCLEDA